MKSQFGSLLMCFGLALMGLAFTANAAMAEGGDCRDSSAQGCHHSDPCGAGDGNCTPSGEQCECTGDGGDCDCKDKSNN